MSTHNKNEELLKRTGTIDDMDALLAFKELSPDEKREVEIHKLLASALSGAAIDSIPIALRQSLYDIEKKPRIDLKKVRIPAFKELVPYLLFAAVVLLVIILPPFSKNEMLGLSTVIAVGSAYIFYDLLKSKFFFYR
jgi:hypothetical protein